MSTSSGRSSNASATLVLLKLVVVNLAVIPALLVWIYASSSGVAGEGAIGYVDTQVATPPVVILGLWIAASLVILLAVGTNLAKLGEPEDSVD